MRLPWLAHDETPEPYITIPQYRFNKTKQHTHSSIEDLKASDTGSNRSVRRLREHRKASRYGKQLVGSALLPLGSGEGSHVSPASGSLIQKYGMSCARGMSNSKRQLFQREQEILNNSGCLGKIPICKGNFQWRMCGSEQ